MEKNTIFITGAGSGIGRATAILFAKQGWYVGVYDINEVALEETMQEIGAASCTGMKMDVANPDSVQVAIDQFIATTEGKMNALFNCAGILRGGRFETLDLQDHLSAIDVNIKGVVNCAYQAFPHLSNTPNSRMISMISGASLYGAPELSVYAATKFAVKGFTEGLELEWKSHGIMVCDIAPPFVNTPMLKNVSNQSALKKFGKSISPDLVANAVWQATLRNRIHWPVTAKLKILFFFADYLSKNFLRRVMKMVSGY